MLAVCCLSCWGGSLSASAPDGDDYNSDSQAVKFCSISVSADPEEGANVSGGGKYTLNGNQVLISTNAMNTADYTYTFMYWTQNGVRTSYNQNFWFTPAEGTFDFVAHYEKKEVEFDPDNPQEPSSTSLFRRYFLYLTTNIAGACSFNMDSGIKVRVGAQLGISANLNPGYQFEGWMQNGEIISTENASDYERREITCGSCGGRGKVTRSKPDYSTRTIRTVEVYCSDCHGRGHISRLVRK